MSRRTDASSPSGGLRVATGTYTGNGAATQAVVGVGFQPRFVIVYPHGKTAVGDRPLALKEDQDGVNASSHWAGGFCHRYQADDVISLDADGFTVGDGTPLGLNRFNEAGLVYSYMCFR